MEEEEDDKNVYISLHVIDKIVEFVTITCICRLIVGC